MLKAVTRSARLVDRRVSTLNQERLSRGQNSITIANFFDHHATAADTETSVTEEDFLDAKQELAPSVSVDELRHYERVRDTFEGTRKKPETETDKSQAEITRYATEGDSSPHKPNDFASRANGAANVRPAINGKRRSRNLKSQADGGASEGSDDYVIRTDKLSLNNTTAWPPSSKGKGKGRIHEMPAIDGAPRDNAAEDLYD